jgi:hypothetical protein
MTPVRNGITPSTRVGQHGAADAGSYSFTDPKERAVRGAAYAVAETDTKAESDTLRQRLRTGEKLSASERNQAHALGVLLPPTEELPTTRW